MSHGYDILRVSRVAVEAGRHDHVWHRIGTMQVATRIA